MYLKRKGLFKAVSVGLDLTICTDKYSILKIKEKYWNFVHWLSKTVTVINIGQVEVYISLVFVRGCELEC